MVFNMPAHKIDMQRRIQTHVLVDAVTGCWNWQGNKTKTGYGKEYDQPFGSMKRAKISRKWDELAKTKSILQTLIYDLENCEINISN